MQDFIRTISPGDGMFEPGNEAHYFYASQSALRLIEAALTASASPDPQSILDLGCGHGRVMRVLQARFPGAALVACDIDQAGVDFCASTFGAEKKYADTDLSVVSFAQKFDLIWSGSVLTHLDQSKWPAYFGLCATHLNPGGMVVFTTHGHHVEKMIRDYQVVYGLPEERRDALVKQFNAEGYGYQDYPKHNDYGVSICSPKWVSDFIHQETDFNILMMSEMAWDDHQDVYAVRFTEDTKIEAIRAYARELQADGPPATDANALRAWIKQRTAADARTYGPRVRIMLQKMLSKKT